jgi:tripartite-type tricarboxylate transporter receptor subunit TctC
MTWLHSIAPYKGGGVALSDMMAGITQVMFPQLPAVLGLATSGDVKTLAVTSSYRLKQLPDVPTLSETVLPGFHVTSWNELYGPRGLPDEVRRILSDALVDAVKNDAQLRGKMASLGVEPVGAGADEAERFFDEKLARWRRVIDSSGIKLEP